MKQDNLFAWRLRTQSRAPRYKIK